MYDQEWTVYWNEYASDTYLYGSKVSYYSKSDVEFQNLLMPPGTVIKKWYSRTNYQRQRIEPALPIIDGESKYQIVIDMECMPDERYLFRLVFFDRYGEEAGFVNIREPVTGFQCPLKTFSYELHLMNSGMTRFLFHSVVIREVTEDESEESAQDLQRTE